MVKNRKPLFVSEAALARLATLAEEKKCYLGDVVDMLLEVKTSEELDAEFEKNKLHSRVVGRIPSKTGRRAVIQNQT